jgi:hypothetical protein
MRRTLAGLLCSLSLSALPLVAEAQSKKPEIISPAELKPGMMGYGLTVFEGTKIEKFDVKVIGVVNGFLTKQDIILIECLDPRIVHSGIVGGMSGSPIYIDGKLAGALSYGWPFGKDPIAGVTPIQDMLALNKIPTRGVDAVTKGNERKSAVKSAALESSPGETAPAEVDAWGNAFSPSPSTAGAVSTWSDPLEVGPYTLVPAATPLAVSGLGPSGSRYLKKALAEYGIDVVAMTGGATGAAGSGQATYYKDLDVKFEPGSSVGVTLMSGDIAAASTGTVTYVDGSQVYGFGHPMMNMGETYFPMNTAWIHLVMASVMRSFKLASPIKEAGSLVQDRQSAIYGDSTKTAPMLSYSLSVESPDTKLNQTYNMKVVRHPLFTPVFIRSAINDVLDSFGQDLAPVVYSFEVKTKFDGQKPLSLKEYFYSPSGMVNGGANLDASESLRAMRDVLTNPFTPTAVESVDVKITARYAEDYVIIKSLQLQGTEVRAGDRVNLYVTVARYNAADEVRAIPFDVPLEAEGQSLEIAVDPGSRVRPELATPESLSGMLENYTKRYAPRSFVVTALLPTKGVAYKGRVVPSLPESVLDSLTPNASTEKARSFKTATRFVQETPELVFGRATLKVNVKAPAAR